MRCGTMRQVFRVMSCDGSREGRDRPLHILIQSLCQINNKIWLGKFCEEYLYATFPPSSTIQLPFVTPASRAVNLVLLTLPIFCQDLTLKAGNGHEEAANNSANVNNFNTQMTANTGCIEVDGFHLEREYI